MFWGEKFPLFAKVAYIVLDRDIPIRQAGAFPKIRIKDEIK